MTREQALADARELKAHMNRWGLACSIELQEGRGSDPWATPIKYHRMHHHTASWWRGPDGNLTPVLSVVKLGRPEDGIPGPLANGYMGFDFVYRILCMGLANHPGQGGPITIDGVRIPADSARGPTWGTEFEGGFQDYDDIPGMLEAMGRADCALADWSARPDTSQMEHSTWAPDRKIDRREFTRTRGIALTTRWRLTGPPVAPSQEANDMTVFNFSTPGKPGRTWLDGVVLGWSDGDDRKALTKGLEAKGIKVGDVTGLSPTGFDALTRSALTASDDKTVADSLARIEMLLAGVLQVEQREEASGQADGG